MTQQQQLQLQHSGTCSNSINNSTSSNNNKYKYKEKDVWIYQTIIPQNGKIRTIERYYNYINSILHNDTTTTTTSTTKSSTNTSPPSSSSLLFFVPDAICLRKYTKLFRTIVHDVSNNMNDNNNNKQKEQQQQHYEYSLILVLLESVIEYMEYRNQSPCTITLLSSSATSNPKSSESSESSQKDDSSTKITSTNTDTNTNTNTETNSKSYHYTFQRNKEIALMNERKIIYQLIQDYNCTSTTLSKSASNSRCYVQVQPICDLSYRDIECDEWGIMYQYELMSIIERSNRSLIRAATMILLSLLNSNSTSNSNSNKSNVIIISSSCTDIDTNTNTNRTIQQHDNNNNNDNDIENMIQHISINTAIQLIGTTFHIPLHIQSTWYDIRQSCDDEYYQRNYIQPPLSQPQLPSPTLSNHDIHTYNSIDPISIERGLKNGLFYRGRLVVSKDNPKESFVTIINSNNTGTTTTSTTTYFIDDTTQRQHPALHHDIVIIQPLPIHLWTCPIGKRRIVQYQSIQMNEEELNNDDDDTSKNTIVNNKTRIQNQSTNKTTTIPVPTARVVQIVQQSRRTVIATLVMDTTSSTTTMTLDDILASSNINSSNNLLVVPMDIRYPKIRIRTRGGGGGGGGGNGSNINNIKKWYNQRLKIEIDGWDTSTSTYTTSTGSTADTNYTYLRGRVIEVIGPIGNIETEIQCLLYENQVILDPFSISAISCLPIEGEQWTVAIDQEKLNNNNRTTIVSKDTPTNKKATKLQPMPSSPATATTTASPQDILLQRRDLRTSRRIFSVDPPGCQDIDDSMHAEVLPNGDIEVGVHIADVTYFIQHNSQLDIEAQKRGTTFYLVDRRYDMLPSLLSANLCSLHGNVDRYAVSVIWILSNDLQTVKSYWFGRTIIHNCAAMTYDQADNILYDRPPDDVSKPIPPPMTAGAPITNTKLILQLKTDLWILTKLGRVRKSLREDIGGAIDLSNNDNGTELKFTLLNTGIPVKVINKENIEIHNTIAELMIMANMYVAERIYTYYPSSSLLRIHRSVEQYRLNELKDVLVAAGLSLYGINNKELAKSLYDAQKSTQSPIVKALFQSLATRAMTEAQYICTGDSDGSGGSNNTTTNDLRHFGLGITYYTHFTSPIRRYADIVVHKQLLASIVLEYNQQQNIVEQQPAYNNKTTSMSNNHTPLPALPSSNVVSILAGEGIDSKPGTDDSRLHDYINAISVTTGITVQESNSIPDFQDETSVAIDENNRNTIDSSLLNPTTNSTTMKKKKNNKTPNYMTNFTSYSIQDMVRICDRLNLHNRLAKLSSYECQSLFLSLYFRNNIEIVQGVVTQLRENGFYVHIPKFDIKGPVYVRDMNNEIQIDPILIGLSSNTGLEPTFGFTSSSCRRYTNGKTVLYTTEEDNDTDERLEVSVPDTKSIVYIIRPLDVVQIQLTCDNWDVRARVPSPRFQLVSKSNVCTTKNKGTNSSLQQSNGVVLKNDTNKVIVIDSTVLLKTQQSLTNPKSHQNTSLQRLPYSRTPSIYTIVTQIPIRPTIQTYDTHNKVQSNFTTNRTKATISAIDNGTERNKLSNVLNIDSTKKSNTNNPSTGNIDIVFPGRINIGSFINMNTRSYQQEELQRIALESANRRRVQVQENASRRSEYDTNQTIQRTITSRRQRLASNKRNSSKK